MPLWSSHSCTCEQDRAAVGRGGGEGRDVEAGEDGQRMLLPGATAKHMECAREKRRGERACYSTVTFPLGKTTRDFPLRVTCLNRREAFMRISTANTEDGENPPNAFTLFLVQGSQGTQNFPILSRKMLPNSCLQG